MESIQVNEPLLYIDQPILTKPKVKMQVDFQTTRQVEKHKSFDKAFKQRTIEEKIDYVLHLPKELPHLKCDVVTESGSHRGMIIKENRDYIILKKHGRVEQQILKSSITDIRLISF